MPTDFSSWSHQNLANLAKEQQAYITELLREREQSATLHAEIVRLNNQDCARLKLLRDLCAEFDAMADMFCKQPVRSAAYRAAMEALK